MSEEQVISFSKETKLEEFMETIAQIGLTMCDEVKSDNGSLPNYIGKVKGHKVIWWREETPENHGDHVVKAVMIKVESRFLHKIIEEKIIDNPAVSEKTKWYTRKLFRKMQDHAGAIRMMDKLGGLLKHLKNLKGDDDPDQDLHDDIFGKD